MFISEIKSTIQDTLQDTFQQVRRLPLKKILKITALATFAMGSINQIMSRRRIDDCLSSDCPDINISDAHPLEVEAVDALSSVFTRMFSSSWEKHSELLRFNIEDPREKLFFATADPSTDPYGALKPQEMAHLLEEFDKHFDARYQVVGSFEEFCRALANAADLNIRNVVLAAHGNPNFINLFKSSWDSFFNQFISASADFDSCFAPLPPDAKIYLISCSTGKPQKRDDTILEKLNHVIKQIIWKKHQDPFTRLKDSFSWLMGKDIRDPFNNIAQAMADSGKRVVLAPTDVVGSLVEFSSEDKTFYHPLSIKITKYRGIINPISLITKSNLYQAFHPRFRNCSPYVDRFMLTEHELAAEAAIKADLIARSLLHKDSPFLEEYFQVCEDNPRKKVLVLTGHEAENSSELHPSRITKVLTSIATGYDLLFKQVMFFHEICGTAFDASKKGNVEAVVIQGVKSSNGMLISKDSNGKEEQIDISKDFRSCFSELSKNTKIIFIGAPLGKDGSSKISIPQRIADITQRIVDAPTCDISPDKIEIQSMSPLTFHHPAHSSLDKWRFGCKENGENLFKSFYPQN